MELKVDLTGEVCPAPLWRVQEELKKMQPGDKIIVITDFNRSVRNIVDLAVRLKYDYDLEEISPGIWEVSVIKG